MGVVLLYVGLGVGGFVVSILILRWAFRIDDFIALLQVIANCTTREAIRKCDIIKKEEAIARKTQKARAKIDKESANT